MRRSNSPALERNENIVETALTLLNSTNDVFSGTPHSSPDQGLGDSVGWSAHGQGLQVKSDLVTPLISHFLDMHPPLLAALSPATLQDKKARGYVLSKWAGYAGLYTPVVILVEKVKPESSCKNWCFCA